MRVSQLSPEFAIIFSVVRRSFLFAIVIAITALITFSLLKHFSPIGVERDRIDRVAEELDSVPPLAGGRAFSISPGKDLVPVQGKDFVFAAWLRLRTPPAGSGRVILFSKLDRATTSKTVPGYALAVSREPEGIRFWLYWNSAKGYEWYPLRTVPLISRRWFLVALAYTDQRYVSVHLGTPRAGKKASIEVLGGYDLAFVGTPKNEADLLVGSEEVRERPQVAALGVLHLKRSRTQLIEMFKDMVRSGNVEPPQLAPESLTLWVSPSGISGTEAMRSLKVVKRAPPAPLKSEEPVKGSQKGRLKLAGKVAPRR